MMKMTAPRAILGIALAGCIALASVGPRSEQARIAAPSEPSAPAAAVSGPVAATLAAPVPPAPTADLQAVELAVQQARASGQGEGEAYRLRAAALSTQTIAMLTERELAEKAWLQRVDAWRAESARLDQGDAAGLRALRERLFSPDEQARLQAYERSETPTLILR